MIQQILSMSALVLLVSAPLGSGAQTAPEPGRTSASQPAALTDGQVKKIDQEAGRITIQHGEIKHLDMPGMTMVFTAKDKALLASVKPGDKVRFMVASEAGKMIVTEIQPTP